ncbi:hypothetical protein QSI_3003 [Clostridioides difficile P28]|nr:hypothetical protein QSI_3003 [Clostridioides difficile P28]
MEKDNYTASYMKKPYSWSSVKAVLDTAFHVLFYLKNTCRIWKIL